MKAKGYCAVPVWRRTTDVLLIDNYPDTCDLFALALRQRNCSVRCVADKSAALESVQDRVPNVILMEDATPGVSTEHFVHSVRSAHPEVAIVLLSSMPNIFDRASALKLKFFVSKPTDLDRLYALVEQAALLAKSRELVRRCEVLSEQCAEAMSASVELRSKTECRRKNDALKKFAAW